MDTITKQLPVQEAHSTTHIHDFRELFGVDAGITDNIIERQKSTFGFSLFLLHSKSVYQTLRYTFLKNSSSFQLLQILFSPIFFIIYLNIILWVVLTIDALYLFFPIIFGSIFLLNLTLFKDVIEKINLFKKSRIFFNIDKENAHLIAREFFDINPVTNRTKLDQATIHNLKLASKPKNIDATIFLYLVSQIWIIALFTEYRIFSFWEVFLLSLIMFLCIFRYLEKIIFLFFTIYYTIYFYIFDKFPRFFSREDQERDLYMDIYRSGNSLIESINSLERDTTLMLGGSISPTLSENFSSTIEKIGDLFTLLENNTHLLEGKEKFQYFLISMINEILVIYAHVFDTFTDKINTIESELAHSDINEEQKDYLIHIIKPILTNRKIQLESMKAKILEKRII